MPKKAVGVFFAIALLGAALFIFLTFPRTRDQIPTSNNQRPFPATPPEPGNAPNPPSGPNKPDGAPVPESVPHPSTPKLPPGPNLRVMAWANASEAKRLSAATDAFTTLTGRPVSLTLSPDVPTYHQELVQALRSQAPPDLCLVSSVDFSGLDSARDLVAVATPPSSVPARAVSALSSGGELKALPDEFSVEVLFYNPLLFDQAGIAYPGPHWNWDMLEADARALKSLQVADPKQAVYPLQMTANFELWNILCTEAGHSALDLDQWHLTDADTKETQLRALEIIQDIFQRYAILAPPLRSSDPSWRLFAQSRVALLIAPSFTAASLPPNFRFATTLLPRDQFGATSANVNGWAVMTSSSERDAAQVLARYLAAQPVHEGWTGMRSPAPGDEESTAAVCHQALASALLPRTDSRTIRSVQFIDQQIAALSKNPTQTAEATFATIQARFQAKDSRVGATPPAISPKTTPDIAVRVEE